MMMNSTVYLALALENPLLSARYPVEGEVLAVLDTGYEGFLAVPEDVFEALRLREMITESYELLLPDGRIVTAQAAYAAARLVDAGVTLEGLVEAFERLSEVIAGQELLSNLRPTLGYCRGS